MIIIITDISITIMIIAIMHLAISITIMIIIISIIITIADARMLSRTQLRRDVTQKCCVQPTALGPAVSQALWSQVDSNSNNTRKHTHTKEALLTRNNKITHQFEALLGSPLEGAIIFGRCKPTTYYFRAPSGRDSRLRDSVSTHFVWSHHTKWRQRSTDMHDHPFAWSYPLSVAYRDSINFGMYMYIYIYILHNNIPIT